MPRTAAATRSTVIKVGRRKGSKIFFQCCGLGLPNLTFMQWLDLVQWPAMAVTLLASWFVASTNEGRRGVGFWLFLASNVLWIVWASQAHAWALIALQIGLAIMNIRGAKKSGAA